MKDKHSTDVGSTNRARGSVKSFTLNVRHALISVECLFSMTLLRECWHVISFWGVDVVFELIDPACSQ